MPRVSIIMGEYNCKSMELLSQTVQSLINQTYTNWELIICDDGSSNNTYSMLESIKQLDPRIKIIKNEENQGLGFALNTCLQYATGEYIARQDDEDISTPNRLQAQVDFLDNHPEYDLVGTNAVLFDDDGEWGNYNLPEYPNRYSFLWSSPFLHPSIMIRKSVYDECNGYCTDKDALRCEDYDLFMRIYASGHIGYNIQKQLYRYKSVNDKKNKYRSMTDRIREAKIRLKGFRSLKLGVYSIPYIIKPILIGLIPQRIFYQIKKSQHEN